MNYLNNRSKIDLKQMSEKLKSIIHVPDLNELDNQIKQFWQKMENIVPNHIDYHAPDMKNPGKVWCLHCRDIYNENEAVWEVRHGMSMPLWWCRNKSCDGAGVGYDLIKYKQEEDESYEDWVNEKQKIIKSEKQKEILERLRKPSKYSKMCHLDKLREFTCNIQNEKKVLEGWDINFILTAYEFAEILFKMIEMKCPIPDPFFVKLFSGSICFTRKDVIFQGKRLDENLHDTDNILKALIKETKGKVPSEMLQFVLNHKDDFPAIQMLKIYTNNNLPVPYEIVEKMHQTEKNKALFKLTVGNLKPKERKELKQFIHDCKMKELEKEVEVNTLCYTR